MDGTNPNDPFNLQRFLDAQEPVFEQVLAELRNGNKTGHWMWFIFPQIAGLGYSHLSWKFAIKTLREAEAYLKHPTLGPRLRDCTMLISLFEAGSTEKIFGPVDSLKFRSSITLFAHATSDNGIFKDALQKHFGGELDPRTLERLS